MKRIEAVIFDWAGTTVDYGCMAPIYAMSKAFETLALTVTLDEIRQPMGMLKRDHIKTVLEMERVNQHFYDIHRRHHQPSDIEEINRRFESKLFSVLENHTELIPGILTVQAYLQQRQIKIGSTTGYTKQMIDIVANKANEQGYRPDYIVAGDQLSRGRPYPYMIQQSMMAFGLQNVRHVLKVGDTIVDIAEGLNAGCWSIGVIKGSSMLGLQRQEAEQHDEKKLERMVNQVKYAMLAAGADYVIESITELPQVIELIEHRMRLQ